MVVVEGPLFVPVRVGGVILATVLVRQPFLFQFGVTEVVSTQEQCAELRGAHFPSRGCALGAALAVALPLYGEPEHGTSWAHVYVVGELPEDELGTVRALRAKAFSPLAAKLTN